MGLDHYYNAFSDGDDGGTTASDSDGDGTSLSQTIDPHLYSKLLFGFLIAISMFLTLVYILFEIELGKKIIDTASSIPNDMVLSVDDPITEKGGTRAVIVNASVVQMPSPTSDSGLTSLTLTEERPPKASAIQSLEQCKMAELLGAALALTLMIYLLLVFLPSGNTLLSVIGITCVTGAFLKDQIKSEWRKERYDRILTIITLMLFIASGLSLATYAKMGIAEGSIYKGAARIVGYDDTEYTNSADKMITRIDLQVSWGGAWGCPLMDKTCYAVVQGALCEQKDDRALQEDQEDDTTTVDGSGNEEEIHTSTYTDDESKETIVSTVEYDDAGGFEEELQDTEQNEDGTSSSFVDEFDSNGDEVVMGAYYNADGTLADSEFVIVEEDDGDGSEIYEEEDIEYEKEDGADVIASSTIYYENSEGVEEDIVDNFDYKNVNGTEELVSIEEYDETIDANGNDVDEETDYEVKDGVDTVVDQHSVTENVDDTEEDSVSNNDGQYDDGQDDGQNDEVEVLEEELKEEDEENEELEDEVEEEEEENEELEDEEEELEDEEEELYYDSVYGFNDDNFEDDYWSGNNWDETWGDYQCQELFEKDLPSIEYDPNTPPGDDESPFVNIYGKCNSCDAYLIDYFSTEHFNDIKAYETKGLYYGLLGMLSLILTVLHSCRQSKKPAKERELGLIPNENSTIV